MRPRPRWFDRLATVARRHWRPLCWARGCVWVDVFRPKDTSGGEVDKFEACQHCGRRSTWQRLADSTLEFRVAYPPKPLPIQPTCRGCYDWPMEHDQNRAGFRCPGCYRFVTYNQAYLDESSGGHP